MPSSRASSSKLLVLVVVGIAIIAGGRVLWFLHSRTWSGITVPAETQAAGPLSADDVSWLFPAPAQAGDFAKLIAVRDLTTANPQDSTKRDPVWPDAAFQQFLAIAASPAG